MEVDTEVETQDGPVAALATAAVPAGSLAVDQVDGLAAAG